VASIKPDTENKISIRFFVDINRSGNPNKKGIPFGIPLYNQIFRILFFNQQPAISIFWKFSSDFLNLATGSTFISKRLNTNPVITGFAM
jgi:hypothetical protein